jgi:hypothetical protein
VACARRGLKFHQVMVAYLQRRHYRPHGRRLRACHPRDLLDQVTALCRYRGVEPTISRDMLDDACRAYFVGEKADEEAAAAGSRRQAASQRGPGGPSGGPTASPAQAGVRRQLEVR